MEKPTCYGVHMDEATISAAPTSFDYQETEKLFKEFGIYHVDVPKFASRAQLFRWRTSTINARLP